MIDLGAHCVGGALAGQVGGLGATGEQEKSRSSVTQNSVHLEVNIDITDEL